MEVKNHSEPQLTEEMHTPGYQFQSTDAYINQESPTSTEFHDIYTNYASAMRMRNREPLEEERFYLHFFEGGSHEKTMMYGDKDDGYLLGYFLDDSVFVPTHFAPSGLRAGYRLIKKLMDSRIPTALFIPDDLVKTIRKLPRWKVTPIKFKQNFRGDNIDKQMVINNWKAIPILANFYLKQTGREKVNALMESIGLFWKRIQGKNIEIEYPLLPVDNSAEPLGGDNLNMIRNSGLFNLEDDDNPDD